MAGKGHRWATAANNRRPSAGRIGLLSTLAAGVAFVVGARAVVPQFDDAYISYRYARNLAEGNGLVYNLGEHVEGFTNLLWTLLVAAGVALGVEANVVGHVLGASSGLGVLWATYSLARVGLQAELRDREWLAAIPPWIVLVSLPFSCWSLSGMETPMFAAFVTAALALQTRGRVGWMTLALALATLTRPEGVLVAAVLFGFAWLRGDELWGNRWVPGLVYAVVLAALTAFRLGYYGELLPNTFFAKVGGVREGRGLWYLKESLATGARYLVVPAAFAALAAPWRCAAALIALVTLYVWRVGGDAFPHARFFVPVLPALAVLAVQGWSRACNIHLLAGATLGVFVGASLTRPLIGSVPASMFAALSMVAIGATQLVRGERTVAALAAAAAGVALVLLVAIVPLGPLSPQAGSRGYGRAAVLISFRATAALFEAAGMQKALTLARRKEPLQLVATGGIGAFGYYSRLPILDIFGLVDPVIARSTAEFEHRGIIMPGHQRTNAAYVFARRPDYILIPRMASMAPALAEILRSDRLQQEYEWDEQARGFRRRDLPRN